MLEDIDIYQYEVASYAQLLERTQKCSDIHAHRRYSLAQKVNELNDSLNTRLQELQTAYAQIESKIEHVQSVEEKLSTVIRERDEQVKERNKASGEAELTLLELHRMQEKLEGISFTDQTKQKLLEDLENQIKANRVEQNKLTQKSLARAGWLQESQLELKALAKKNVEQKRTIAELKKIVKSKNSEIEKDKAAATDRVNTLEGELNAIKSERDARAKEKAEAQKIVEVLKAEIKGKTLKLLKKGNGSRACKDSRSRNS